MTSSAKATSGRPAAAGANRATHVPSGSGPTASGAMRLDQKQRQTDAPG